CSSRSCRWSARTGSASRRSTVFAGTESSTTSTWCGKGESTSRACSPTPSCSTTGATPSLRWPRRTAAPPSRSRSTFGSADLAGSLERHLTHAPGDRRPSRPLHHLAERALQVVEVAAAVSVPDEGVLAPRREIQCEQLGRQRDRDRMDAHHARPLPPVPPTVELVDDRPGGERGAARLDQRRQHREI